MAFALPLLAAVGTGGGAAALGGSLATALSVGGAALTGVMGMQQSNYQAKVLRNNAEVEKQNAGRASDAAQMEQIRSDHEYAALLGEQMAAQSASGLDVFGRSQLKVRDQTRQVGRDAARDIYVKGSNDAQAHLAESQNLRAQASAAKAEGKRQLVSGLISAGTKAFSDPGVKKSLAGAARSTKKLFR